MAEDIDDVVDKADDTATDEGGERKPCLAAVEVESDCDGGDCDDADDASHCGEFALEFVRMEFCEDFCILACCGGFALLFPEFVLVGEVRVDWREQHRE